MDIVRGVQIPIAGRVAPPFPPTRGFVLCSFSDAGPRACGATFMGPASEKLNKSGLWRCVADYR